MSSVETAIELANDLIRREARGPGDVENAMRRIESKYGVPHSFLWALRYRPPKDILLGAWMGLLNAHEVECARQKRLLDAALAKDKALKDAANRSDTPILVRAALAVAPAED